MNPWLGRGERATAPRDPIGRAIRRVTATIVAALRSAAQDAVDAGVAADEARDVLAGTSFLAGLSVGLTVGTDDVAAARAVRDWLSATAMDGSARATAERERLAAELRRAVWESKGGS